MTIPEIGNELAGVKEAAAHVITGLTQLAESMTKLVAALESTDADRPVPQAPQKKAPELAEVRALLAEISRSGKTAEVRRLLESHGCQKLSQVEEQLYEVLLEEARALL